jgi:hypothetical protein
MVMGLRICEDVYSTNVRFCKPQFSKSDLETQIKSIGRDDCYRLAKNLAFHVLNWMQRESNQIIKKNTSCEFKFKEEEANQVLTSISKIFQAQINSCFSTNLKTFIESGMDFLITADILDSFPSYYLQMKALLEYRNEKCELVFAVSKNEYPEYIESFTLDEIERNESFLMLPYSPKYQEYLSRIREEDI